MTPATACGFTGFETFLISILTAFIACVGLMQAMTRKFALKSECIKQHEGDLKLETEKEDAIGKKLSKVINSQTLQFMMLRAIIIHLDLPPEKKEQILNMTVKTPEE